MAGSRVNKKFVTLLVGGLVTVVCVGGGLAYFFVFNNASRLAAAGDAALARQDFLAADKLFSKAVNKEQTNPEYLRKWIEAMKNYTPDTETAYRAKYSQDYLRAHMALARALRTDVKAYREALALFHNELREIPRVDPSVNNDVVRMVDESLAFFGGGNQKEGDVLRRYSGLALLRSYNAAANMNDREIERARTDLEAALAADPKDGEVAVGLVQWWDRRGRELLARQDVDGGNEALAKSRQVLTEQLAANPEDPLLLLTEVAVFFGDKQNELRTLPDRAAREAGLAEVMKEGSARLDRVAAAIGKMSMETVEARLIDLLQTTEERYEGPQVGMKRAEALYKRALEARPADTRMLMSLGVLMASRNEYEKAIEQMQRVADLKQQPLSFIGVQQFGHRMMSRYLQAQYALKLHETAEQSKKAEWLQKAIQYRGELAKLTESDSSQLLRIDAELDLARGDVGPAQKKLLEYCRRTNNEETEALWLLAEASFRVNEPGTAEKTLQALLAKEPFNFRALARLGQYYANVRRFADAVPYLQQAAAMDPSNETLKTMLTQTMAAAGASVSSNDPMVVLRQQVDKLEAEGKAEQAFKLLQDTYAKEKRGDLAALLAAKTAQRGDRVGALKIVDEFLATDASDDRLKRMRAVLSTDNPLEQRIALIDVSGAPEAEKAVAKAVAYREAGDLAKSAEWTDKAAAADAAAPGVLELRFQAALDAKDFTNASKLADEARTRDVDRVEGATFRARVFDAQNRLADAVRELEAVRNRSTFSVEAGRILAAMMIRQDRVVDAVAVFRDALARRPQDRNCLLGLISLLVRLDRGQEAMEEARSRAQYHMGDAEVIDAWLKLEAAFGDRDLALRERQKQYDLNPNDRATQVALASLYIDMKRWPQAREMIDRIKKDRIDLEIAQIEARWNSEQARLTEALQAFDEYIATLPEDQRTPEVYLAKGRFMERVQLLDEAIKAYEAASKNQSKAMEADKALGDLYARQGRNQEALEVYGRILAGNADTPDHSITKRSIELQIRSRKIDEALAALDKLGSTVIGQDAVLSMQYADAIRLKGDEKRGAELLDQAVAKFPNNPQVFYRRAMANLNYPQLRTQVMQDLDQAIRLQPEHWEARQARAVLHEEAGNVQASIGDLREAVKLNPMIDELRVSLLRYLLSLGDRDTDAVEVVEGVIKRRPGDLALLVNTGDIFREAGRVDRAEDYYERAYKQSAQLFIVLRYLDLLQTRKPPALTKADEVLRTMGSAVDAEPSLLMSRAKQFAFRGKQEEALRDMTASLRLIKKDQPRLIMAWFGDVKRNMSRPDDIAKLLDAVDREGLIPGWTTFFRAGVLLEKPETEKEGIARLEAAITKTEDMQLVQQMAMILQAKYYQLNDCENSLRITRWSVEKFPNDAFMLNNLAFMIVKCGGDPKEAVPFAERALNAALAQGQTQTADVYDTLGWVYTRAGMLKEAEAPLLIAYRQAGNSSIRPTVMMHIAEWQIARGDMVEAEKLIQGLDTYFANPQAARVPGQEAQFAELKKKFEAQKKK